MSIEPSAASKLEAASTEIVDALFFARAEALRTGGTVGVRFGADGGLQASADMLTVFSLTAANRTILSHPLNGKPYQIDLMHAPYGNGVALVDANFDADTAIVFNGTLGQAGSPLITQNGQVSVRLGAATRTVTVDAETGRVSVQ